MSQTHRVHARGDRLWTRAGTADGADEPVSSTSPSDDDDVTSKTDKPAGGIVGWWRDYNARVKDMASQIKALGLAGFTAYGIFNTAYYTLAFTTAWSIRSVPANIGIAATWRIAGEVMALVWAGSQVTKLARAGMALALAPKIDGFMNQWSEKWGKSKEFIFVGITLGCFLGSASLFAVLIVLKAQFA
tara:strand:+ start:15 stop:578 length:564 start_codon:yes stop_codon:yes gene_type:complete